MKSYQEMVDEASKRFTRKYQQIQAIKHLIPEAEAVEDQLESGFTYVDGDGINLTISPMTVKQILIYLDENFWQRGMETADPIKSSSQIRLRCFKKPGLYLMFNIAEGDGCYKVQTGVREEKVYEFKCFKTEKE